MSHQESDLEVVIAVVTGGGEDVGHPAGGCLWQDSGDESEAVLLGRSATQEELGLSYPKPGGVAGCPEVGQLEEARSLPWGCGDSQLGSGVVLVHTHVNCAECEEKSAKKISRGHPMLTQAWLVLD